MIIFDWVARWADYSPHKTAVYDINTGQRVSWIQLHRMAERMVIYFNGSYKEGDRIAVLMEHSPFLIALFTACQRLGLILVPLNYRLSANEIAKQLRDCSPALLIFSEFYADVAVYQKEFNQTVSLADFNGAVAACQAKHSVNTYVIKEESPLFLFYTSGTTAQPKGVLYTNRMLFWNSLNTSMQLGISCKDRTLSILPPYHTSGWNVLVTPLLHNGGMIIMMGKIDPDRILEVLQREKITLLMALPTVLHMISRCGGFTAAIFAHLRFIISGGESISPELIKLWKNEKQVNIRPGYGLTEAGPSITSLHEDFALCKPESIGKPNFYVNLDIVDDNGVSVKAGVTGELLIGGNTVTPGYWNNSVATKDKIKNGWLHTGDLALRDEDGFYYLKGRVDDMFISGGENIFPEEIETVLNRHPLVDRSVVIPFPDRIWGERGVAFIESSGPLTEYELRTFLKDQLARFKHPRDFVIMQEFPVTGFGKVSRKDLCHIYELQKLKTEKLL